MTHPFAFPPDAVARITPDSPATTPAVHPIHQAVEWQTALAGNPGLRMADIARQQGLSRARVTQAMRLLDLPEAVKKQLLDLRDAHHIRMLSERKLRAIIAHDDPTTQFQAFRRLVESAGADSHA